MIPEEAKSGVPFETKMLVFTLELIKRGVDPKVIQEALDAVLKKLEGEAQGGGA